MWNGHNMGIVNPYTYAGDFDQTIKFALPTFYGVSENGLIVGVNSFYHVNNSECRSRGLYIIPDYRGKGLSKKLLEYSIDMNKNEGYVFIWSKPRVSAIRAYTSAGFEITTSAFAVNPDHKKTIHPNVMCKYIY